LLVRPTRSAHQLEIGESREEEKEAIEAGITAPKGWQACAVITCAVIVEQAAAASGELEQQARLMSEAVAQFRLGGA
jgi:hypothetical protein